MANHKSSKKRAKQTVIKTARNNFFRTKLKNTMKSVLEQVETKDIEKSQEAFKKANKFIHHCVSKGILKKKTASRRVALLHSKINTLSKTA